MGSDGSDQDARYALSKLLQRRTMAEYERLKLDLQCLLLRTNPKTLDEAFSLARVAETRFANLDIWEFLRSNPSTLGEDFFKARITEARFEIIAKEDKEQIIEKKIDVILPLPLQGEFASPEVKGSLDADEDNGVYEIKAIAITGALTPTELKRMQNVPYASVVGSIMYDVRCTRPDIAFAQNITSRFQHNLGDLHWTIVKNILKYLRNTKDMFLVYEGDIKQELRVPFYTDAGYLTDVDDLKSQTRYVFVLNGGAVDWKSTKQSIFATSSPEAEYITAYDASKEAVWVRKFISGLGVVPKCNNPSFTMRMKVANSTS
ncbi:hypothetical protein Tco_0054207 [Tanacetum coccineum]